LFSDDIFIVEQKLVLNPAFAEFSLRPMRNIEGRKLPGMVCLKNLCQLRYRRWDAETESFIYDTSALACTWTEEGEGNMFDINNQPTSNPAEDECPRTLDG